MTADRHGDIETGRIGLMKSILMKDLGLDKEDLDETWEIYESREI